MNDDGRTDSNITLSIKEPDSCDINDSFWNITQYFKMISERIGSVRVNESVN